MTATVRSLVAASEDHRRLPRPSTLAHLTSLFGRLDDGHAVGVFGMVDRRTRWSTVDDLHDLATTASVLDRDGQDVGLLVNPRRPGLPPTRRGGAADVSALVAVWADVDLDRPGHAPPASGLPLPSEHEAAHVTDVVVPRPSFQVFTPGGLHLYWLLTCPWVFATDADRAEAASLSARWNDHLAEAFRRARLHFDRTGNLDRHLRPAGTHRRKVGTTLPVVLEDGDGTWPDFGVYAADGSLRRDWRFGRTYSVDELDAVATLRLATPPPPTAPRPQRRPRPATPTGDSPADLVDAEYSWGDVFEPHGWEAVGRDGDAELWRRPGASSRYSAKAWAHACVVHSTAAGLPCGKGHRLSKFRAVAHLRFQGDERATARAVRAWASSGGPKP